LILFHFKKTIGSKFEKILTTAVKPLQGLLPWFNLKWCLHRRENITCYHCRQRWRFEKIGGFLLKSHRSEKLLDPNRVCERTLQVDFHWQNFEKILMIFVKPLQGLLPWFDLKVDLHWRIFMLEN
jgi:hypothetical protein